jgi:hypothetical protein
MYVVLTRTTCVFSTCICVSSYLHNSFEILPCLEKTQNDKDQQYIGLHQHGHTCPDHTFIHVYVYTYTRRCRYNHTCIHVPKMCYSYVHRCVCLYTHINAYTNINAYIHTHITTHIHATHTCTDACVYTHTHKCIHEHTCLHTYTHNYTYTYTAILSRQHTQYYYRRHTYMHTYIHDICGKQHTLRLIAEFNSPIMY